jgi:hypothetical protein
MYFNTAKMMEMTGYFDTENLRSINDLVLNPSIALCVCGDAPALEIRIFL